MKAESICTPLYSVGLCLSGHGMSYVVRCIKWSVATQPTIHRILELRLQKLNEARINRNIPRIPVDVEMYPELAELHEAFSLA